MDTSELPPQEDTIILPISLYITRALVANSLEWVEITFIEATILLARSTNERLYHIEMPSTDNALQKPILWNRNAWVTSSLKKQREVAAALASRRAYATLRNNRNSLMLILQDMLDIPEEELLVTATNIVVRSAHPLMMQFSKHLENMEHVRDEDRVAFKSTLIIKPKGPDAPEKYWR
jgi:hypothetical protein